MIDIRNAMNDIYKNLEPTLTKCGFRITTPADISDGIPVEVTSGRAVMDFSGENKALRIEHYDNKIALLWLRRRARTRPISQKSLTPCSMSKLRTART